jgi:hypothetical protein
MSPVRLIHGASFDPETTTLLVEAYENACATAGADASASLKELFAKRVLQAASRGERDREKLTAYALHGTHKLPDVC